jgi:hypothetical protein
MGGASSRELEQLKQLLQKKILQIKRRRRRRIPPHVVGTVPNKPKIKPERITR